MVSPARPAVRPVEETASSQGLTWHLLTGEYPPAPGGVSDYTRLIACALAAAGDQVEVWAPACGGEAPRDPGVRVNWLPGNFGPAALGELERGLRSRPGPRRLLVQYVPHAFGYQAMNVALVHWLKQAKRRERVWVMFHEVCFPRYWGQPFKHTFLATVQRWMARQVALSAHRRFVATPQWKKLLHSLGHLPGTTEWLPVPSNVATEADPSTCAAIRAGLVQGDGQILGHFGTYGDSITQLLTPLLLAAIGRDPRRVALLVGRGASEYASQLLRTHSNLAGRIIATGALEAQSLANHLDACDLLLQPYPGGADARRGSLMASVALGLPVVSSCGPNTEPVWKDYDAVCLVPNAVSAWADSLEKLLADPVARLELGKRARRLYAERFAVERTVDVLKARDREDGIM